MNIDINDPRIKVPEPFNSEQFELLQEGIYDNPSINVYVNQLRDFAFLHPKTSVNYKNYLPRVKKLKQEKYKNQRYVNKDRFNRIKHHLNSDISNMLEIGAGDGSFLSIVKHELPDMELAAVEIDSGTDYQREQISGLKNHRSLEEICNHHARYDAICLFHVIEHIIDPSSFLSKINRSLMHSDSIIIVEVPSLFDPLLTLYNCESFKKYYFQAQHPYTYSNTSIVRLMERYGFVTEEVINYQRYGLENHLNWLINNTPGGNDQFMEIFNKTNKNYIAELESVGRTDSVIWAGKLKADNLNEL